MYCVVDKNCCIFLVLLSEVKFHQKVGVGKLSLVEFEKNKRNPQNLKTTFFYFISLHCNDYQQDRVVKPLFTELYVMEENCNEIYYGILFFLHLYLL